MFVAVVALFALLFVALFGERIAPHESIYFVVEHGSDPRPYDPGLVFPLGSDVLGRDLFSLVLAGARATLTIVLLGGIARVAAGLLVAAIGSWWQPTRLATESLAELVSAVPATLVALVLVKVFVKTDTNVLVFVGALLVIGWAGPYRIIRAEVDRLRQAAFTQGAVAIGVGRWRLFRRHHLPHLVPVIAMNLSQQIVASLVLVAELGVLSVFVGPRRLIDVEESLTAVRTGIPTAAVIADIPEWGGLLANARTLENLWTTRWLILVPGVAFAITAVAVGAIGFAVARRYARRDVTQDLRGRGAAAITAGVLSLFVVSSLMPERHEAALDWARATGAEVRSTPDLQNAFEGAGLRPIGGAFSIARQASTIVQSGPARASVGSATVTEPWPRKSLEPPAIGTDALAFVTAETSGGLVEAPLVFAARGISPSDYPPRPIYQDPTRDLGFQISDYADDYAGIDVRGKVVLLVRFMGIVYRPNTETRRYAPVPGPPANESINNAIKRGAAAVLFVDPDLSRYQESFDSRLGYPVSPYSRLEGLSPPSTTSGVPVVLLSAEAADRLVGPLELGLSRYFPLDEPNSDHRRSAARATGVTARVDVPLTRQTAVVTSLVGEVGGVAADAGRVLVWAVREPGSAGTGRDVVAALARTLNIRRAPFIFVDFDPSVDAHANARGIIDVLKDRRISLVVVLDKLEGGALRFTTPHGDLIPAFDLYAEKAGARHEVTRTTAPITSLSGVAPLVEVKTVLVSGDGGAGDLRADAAALLGYLAGRLALGAEELPR
jgi:peptide/nickel transport system permease protein